MALAIFNGYAGVLSNVNACREFFSWTASVITATRSSRNTSELPCEDKAAARRQSVEEIERLGDDLWKLKTSMPKMLDLIDRVEFLSHKEHVAALLPDIKTAVYDAEDLLDEFDCDALKLKVECSKNLAPDQLQDTCVEFYDRVRSNDHIRKVDRIQKNLDHIHKQSRYMGLHQALPKFDKSVRPETTSNFNEPKMFGRQEELKNLMEALGVRAPKRARTESEERMTELPVFSIVGMGGVGKTTMAQQICKDTNVNKHFGTKNIIWTCVSYDFDTKRLTKEIIESLGGDASSNNLNVLMGKLEGHVKSKKFLLVLDDVWDDILKDHGAQWISFCASLKYGAEGSRILVTTRSREVAKLVGPMHSYELKGLQDKVFWDFFKSCAFGSTSPCNNRESLECIGKKIVPKLKGSPLAARTIGRLLAVDLRRKHWEYIMESELWQIEQKEFDILPALRLSYMCLPQKLKRCFSICAIFPKDHKFRRDFLADIWIAQGYVEGPQEASMCFDALANRSFFQKASPRIDEYVIHDLMHDTAQLVSCDECFIIKHASDLDNVPSNVRHLSIFTNGEVRCSESKRICNKKKLRILICDESYSSAEDFEPVVNCWFKELLKTRVLSIKLSSVVQLPESMGNSKHLRYLRLLGSSTFCTFPSSVCRLHRLKVVEGGSCLIQRFPPDFSDALSLQKINSKGFAYKKDHSGKLCLNWSGSQSPETVKMMENQMEILPHWNLQHLRVKGYGGESCPSWLQPNLLPMLRSLEFLKCDYLKSIPFFVLLEGSRSDKLNRLEELVIINCVQINWQGTVVLPTSLRRLTLDRSGNFMDHFVRCFLDLTFLTHLRIIGCESLTCIPLHVWRSNLPSLEELYIGYCDNLTTIVSEASSSSIKGFSSLAKIRIERCRKLLSMDELLKRDCLHGMKTMGSVDNTAHSDNLNRLEELVIINCGQMNWQGSVVLPTSLRRLILDRSGNFMDHFVRCFTSCVDINSSLDLTSLTHLSIIGCESLTSIPLHVWRSNLPSLEELYLDSCDNLTSIVSEASSSSSSSSSSDVKGFSSLAKIRIERCRKLLSMDEFLKRDCLPGVKTIWVFFCGELMSLSVDTLDRLQDLLIIGSHFKLDSRRVMILPSSLKNLRVGCCEGIECINLANSNMASSPPVLEELSITSCPGLKSIGGAAVVDKIKKVNIRWCPELNEIQQPLCRCLVGTADAEIENWHETYGGEEVRLA